MVESLSRGFAHRSDLTAFTSRLVREALGGNGVALQSLLSTSPCDLADRLLSSSSSSLTSSECNGASSNGAVLFAEFEEPMQRQDVVGSPITGVGSGVNVKPAEVDAALRVFCNIVYDGRKGACSDGANVEDGAAALRPFTPFLTSMLDHLRHMSPGQVRHLFLLLFAVKGEEDNDGGMLATGSGCNIKLFVCDSRSSAYHMI